MKTQHNILIIILINFPLIGLGQSYEKEALKKYKSYEEINLESIGIDYSRTVTLTNGLVDIEKMCLKDNEEECYISKLIHDSEDNLIGNIAYDKEARSFSFYRFKNLSPTMNS